MVQLSTRNQGTQMIIGGAGMMALIGLTACATVGMIIGFALGSSSTIYAAVAMLAGLIPLFAGVARRNGFDPFEPINLVALAILFGTTARTLWLLSSESSRVDFIMMGTNFDEVSANSPWMLLSIVSLTVGYMVCNFSVNLARFESIRNYQFDSRRTNVALLATALMSIIGIVMLMQSFGISLNQGLLSLSVKRVYTYVSDSGEIVYGSGSERFLGLAAQHGLLLLAGLLISGVVRLNSYRLGMIAGLGLLSVTMPFLTSSRTSIALVIIHTIIILYYYGKLQIKVILVAAGLGFFVLAGLGAVRESNTIGDDRGYSALDRVLGSGNSLDLVRTSAIMDRMPEVQPFEYGRTYLALLAAPIPRSIWVDKPQVGLGPYVKGKIFGEDVRLGGWPSGLIAEGWINFGMFGLFLPLFLFGGLLRIYYETCRPYLGISLPITLVYAVTVWRLGFDTIGMNFAHGLSQAFINFIPMLLVLGIAKSATRKQSPQFANA